MPKYATLLQNQTFNIFSKVYVPINLFFFCTIFINIMNLFGWKYYSFLKYLKLIKYGIFSDQPVVVEFMVQV